MLSQKNTPEGLVWVRAKFDPLAYKVPRRQLEDLVEWRDAMPYSFLWKERGGPLLGSYSEDEHFTQEGQQWVRLAHLVDDYFIEIELLPSGYIGQVVAVPPERAYQVALARDQRSGRKVEIET